MNSPAKRWMLAAGVGGSMLVGGALGSTFFALAPAIGQTTAVETPANDAAAGEAARPKRDPSKGGHMRNGITETLLTGDAAAKVTAAANAAVPGGTIHRVENDAEGAAYEAHMTKPDGTRVTVKIDAEFKLIEIEEGKGPRA